MRTKIHLSKRLFVGPIAFVLAGLTPSLHAADIVKANNSTSLTTNSSWTGNVVPTSADTMVFDNTLSSNSTTANLGGNLTVLGMNATATPVGGATRQWGIGNTANATLTIGSGGINKAANTSAFVISSAIALGANQTWTLNAVTGTGIGNLQLNGTSFSANGNTLAINGAGVLDIRTTGSLTLGSTVTIDTTVSINGNSTTTDVTFGGSNTANTINVVAGKLSGSTIGNFGVASSFGDGGTNTAITLGGGSVGQNGIMSYTGNTVSSNRTVSRDARSVASGIEVTTAGQTLTISGNLSSGAQTNVLGSGWAFSGAGNLTLTGVINNSSLGNGTTITKTGSGTLTLGGASANTYTGNTTITVGTLIASTNKSLGDTSSVLVNGGSLDVRGVATGTVTLGAAANFVLTSGDIRLTLGTSFDSIVSSGAGAFSLTGGSLVLDVNGAGFNYANTYAVFTGFGGANTVSGLSFSGYDTVNYSASLGTNGVLSFAAIPEPSTYVLLAMGLGAVGFLRSRRVRE